MACPDSDGVLFATDTIRPTGTSTPVNLGVKRRSPTAVKPLQRVLIILKRTLSVESSRHFLRVKDPPGAPELLSEHGVPPRPRSLRPLSACEIARRRPIPIHVDPQAAPTTVQPKLQKHDLRHLPARLVRSRKRKYYLPSCKSEQGHASLSLCSAKERGGPRGALYGQTSGRRLYVQSTILAVIIEWESFMKRTNEIAILIESDMLHCLENWQLAKLREVLGNRLRGVKITQMEESQPSPDDNERHLAAFISAKAVEGCSDKTLCYYEKTVTKALREMGKPVECVTTDDIRSYLDGYHRANGAGKVTVDNVRRILSSFFAWLEDEDRIVKSPVRRIHKVRSRRLVRPTYSDEDLESMRDACTEPRDLALVDLLSSTGMRVGELVSLDRDRINLRERECVVLGKGDKERVVYFDARTKVHLQRYLESRLDDDPALFVTLTSPCRRLAVSGIEIRLRELGRRLKMERVYPHKFRRTLATRAIDKGMPIEQVQRLLGHQKIDTTLMYAMVDQENVRISHRKFIC